MAVTPFVRQLIIVIGTMFAAFTHGSGMGYPSILLYQLKRESSDIPLDLDTASWLGSLHGVAGILGVIAPIVMQCRGRKFTFIAGCLVYVTGWTIAYIASTIAMILVSEFLHGFGATVLHTVSYDCLSEVIPPAYRNIAVQTYGVICILGVSVPGIFAKLVHWRTLSILLCLPSIIAILISMFWLESPLWLAYKDEIEKFKTNFIKLRGTDDLSMKELHDLMAARNEKLSISKTLKGNTFLHRLRRQTTSRDFILPALHVFLLLNHYYWSGTVVVLIYSMELISNGTHDEDAAVVGGIVINLVLVFGAIISNVLIRFFNNKPIMMISTFGTIGSLLSVSIVTYLQNSGMLHEKSMVILYLLVSYMICTSLGQAPIAFTMTSELMPVKHRGLGGALFVICTSSLSATSLKISPYLFVSIRLWGTFLLYALNSIVCGFLIWKYVPETKGKTLQEIENFYNHGTFEIKWNPDEIQQINIKDGSK